MTLLLVLAGGSQYQLIASVPFDIAIGVVFPGARHRYARPSC
jgi:hypothetical protein